MIRSISVFDFEGAALSEFALSAGGLAEDVLAVAAGDDGLGMAEDDSGLVAASALDVHEVAVGGGNQTCEFVLVLFGLEGGVQQVTVHPNIEIFLPNHP